MAIIKSHFFKNYTYLTLSTGIARLLGSGSIFLLTFFFTPEEIGKYSLFVLLTTFLGIFYSFRSEELIHIIDNEEAKLLKNASISLSLHIAVILQFVFFVLYGLNILSSADFLLLPLCTLLFMLYTLSREVKVWQRKFRWDTLTSSFKALIMFVLQVGAGIKLSLIHI